jgi:catechol 2,3-dioxygenase-like lactoylglutathione lyase family enzyme
MTDEIGNDEDEDFYGVVPVFLVDDILTTVEYYRDRLGFEIDYVYGDPLNYGSVSRGSAVVHFQKAEPPGRRNGVRRAGPGNGVDAFFVVRHVDRIHGEFARKGAIVITGPASHDFGMREFKIEDTNGYILVFAEELATAPESSSLAT